MLILNSSSLPLRPAGYHSPPSTPTCRPLHLPSTGRESGPGSIDTKDSAIQGQAEEWFVNSGHFLRYLVGWHKQTNGAHEIRPWASGGGRSVIPQPRSFSPRVPNAETIPTRKEHWTDSKHGWPEDGLADESRRKWKRDEEQEKTEEWTSIVRLGEELRGGNRGVVHKDKEEGR